ncbi:hypothetical protein [Rhodococcus sp. X156]|uniref:hypothetical protein n=1 Tax=Rhodococcus sp. X156 TaxID=2499145 RepID=UPI001F493582|nr:hypothetical protein [Rhodococcus sp. X156]
MFSTAGLLIGVAVLGPSLLLLVAPPQEGLAALGAGTTTTDRVLTVLERLGQAGVLVALVLSGDRYSAPLDGWFAVGAALLAGYYALWLRYLLRGRHLALLFGPLAGVPVPLAVLPVLALGCAAAWGRSVWLGTAVVVLAAGHWPTSWRTWRRLEQPTAASA